jgi:hypothetical protein
MLCNHKEEVKLIVRLYTFASFVICMVAPGPFSNFKLAVGLVFSFQEMAGNSTHSNEASKNLRRKRGTRDEKGRC